MKKFLFAALIVVIFLIGCSLKRTNPLDPNAQDITVPNDITNILISHSPAHATNYWVQLKWDKLPIENADGYYVYRGQSYNGTFQRIEDYINTPNSTDSLAALSVIWADNSIVPGYYYYKISAYKKHGNPPKILEGHISPYAQTSVPQ